MSVRCCSVLTDAFADCRRVAPCLVMLDLDTRRCRRLSSVTRLREQWPRAKILTITGEHIGFEHLHALDFGAFAYLSKEAPLSQLRQAIAGALAR